MRIIRRVAGIAAATAVGLGTMLTVAAPAQAGTTGSACTDKSVTYSSCAGYVSFNHQGEWFTIWDNDADGAGQVVNWEINGYSIKPLVYRGGADTRGSFNRSAVEGDRITFQICINDNGTTYVDTCASGSAIA